MCCTVCQRREIQIHARLLLSSDEAQSCGSRSDTRAPKRSPGQSATDRHSLTLSHTCVDNCKNVAAVPKLPLCVRLPSWVCSTSIPFTLSLSLPRVGFYGQLHLLFHLKRFPLFRGRGGGGVVPMQQFSPKRGTAAAVVVGA